MTQTIITQAMCDRMINHMNEDHADANLLYVHCFAGLKQATAARMTSIDEQGIRLMAQTPAGEQPVMIQFSQPLTKPEDARRMLVEMAQQARATLSSQNPESR
jgi:putative heme iron utilization protein